VAIFADTTGYGEAGMNDVVKALAAKELKPVHVARFPIGVKDLSEEMKKARDAGANVIFAYTVGPENAVIAQSRDAIGWRVPHVGAWPLSFPNFIKPAGKSAEGALMSQTFIAEPSNERRAAFLAAYDRKYASKRIPVPMAAAQAYDATYLMLYAMFGVKTGELTGPAIKAALEDLQRPYYGVVTTYDRPFSADDKDAITRNMLVMGVVRNGLITFAYPEDAKKNFIIQRKQ
jgi:branched-chain amino acid transport system substrate-binding protein